MVVVQASQLHFTPSKKKRDSFVVAQEKREKGMDSLSPRKYLALTASYAHPEPIGAARRLDV